MYLRAGVSLSRRPVSSSAVRREAMALGLAVALLLLAAAPIARGDFEGSVPDATAFTTQRKLVRFSNGTLALAYVIQANGTNRVQVAESADGTVWTSLSPPSLLTPSADRPSMAVDSQDTLHLAWTANGTGDRQVWYASYSQGHWSAPLQVSETAGYSGFPSIAVDSLDRVHVAWYGFDGTYYQIYYRMKDASGWGSQIAVTAQAIDATNPALAIDGQDHVHIVWYRINTKGTSFEVSYAYLVGTNATLKTLSGPTESAFDPTIAIDSAGNLHVAWVSYAGNTSRIAYTAETLSGWTTPVAVTPSPIAASHPSLALDAAGGLYLFFQTGDGQIDEERQVNGTWAAPVTVSSGAQNTYPSTRWSYYPVRSPAGGPTVDVVWTQAVAGGYTVRFATESGGSAPPGGDSLPWPIVGLAVVLVAAIVVGVLVRRRFRR